MDTGLISPDPTANSFALPDGTVYTATEDISIPRMRALQKWEYEFGFNNSWRAEYEARLEIRRLINERQSISEIAYINEASLRGFATVDRNTLYEVQVCSLWYNAPDEDPTTFDLPALFAKMNRWEAAGLGSLFFFIKAATCVRGFREAWQQQVPANLPGSDAP